MKEFKFKKIDGDYAIVQSDSVEQAVKFLLTKEKVSFDISDCVSEREIVARLVELKINNFKESYLKTNMLK